jgi:hypothetical protein
MNEAEMGINSVETRVLNGASRSFPRQAADSQVLGFAKKRQLMAQQWQCFGSYRLFFELALEDQPNSLW